MKSLPALRSIIKIALSIFARSKDRRYIMPTPQTPKKHRIIIHDSSDSEDVTNDRQPSSPPITAVPQSIEDVSSDSGSNDPNDPISRKARKLAVRSACNRQAGIQSFFQSVSNSHHISLMDAQMQTDIMDLRSVKTLTAPNMLITDHDEPEQRSDDSESSSSSPKQRKNGYVVDGFVVNSSESECDDQQDDDEHDDVNDDNDDE